MSTDAAVRVTNRGRLQLERAKELLEHIENTAAPPTRQNVLEPLNDLLLAHANADTEARLLAEVHPELVARQAAEALARDADRFQTALRQDRPLYERLQALDPRHLDAPAARALTLTLQDMRRAGVALPDVQRLRVRQLREETLLLEQEFARNIRDDVRSIELTGPQELEGLPADYGRAHVAGPGGTIRITTDYPDYIPFMAYAKSDRARRLLMQQMQNRATPRNLEVLDQMLAKRHELATLLGYPNWAEYATEDKMTRSAEAARSFVERAQAAARESGAAERPELLEAKRRDDPSARTLGEWEVSYYLERVKAERFHFDARGVRPYFEFGRVKQAIMDLNAELFGLTFVPVRHHPDVWHSSVETYEVKVDGRPMGHISLDMHPREGKFKHAACMPWRLGAGGKEAPHMVLVCNFPDPSGQTAPALMEHREVVTFFHEFGHLVHGIVRGNVPWVRLGWVAEWDFVEAPSQFLEEWIFDFDVLRRFARHVETGQTIPVELVEGLRAARDFGRGIQVQRQLYFSALSMYLHDRDPRGLDTTAAVHELARRYAPFELLPDNHFQASFGHLEGYTALYYTYMWSLVIAKDLLSAFGRGLMDTAQARRYRDLILAPGGLKPAADLIQDFLGRPYNFDAFKKWLAPSTSGAALSG